MERSRLPLVALLGLNDSADRMSSSPVFASYAQADRDKHLDKFVTDFWRQLGGFQGVANIEERKKLVFFDRDSLQAGERWSPKIIEALRHARVLICLMSHTYLRRPWCGRELEMFLQRHESLQLPAATSVRFIFPIWWQKPKKPRPLPKRLDRLNWQDPGYPPRYPEGGVQNLARKQLWTQFQTMVDHLANLVHETLEGAQQLPPGAVVAEIEEIVNAFDEQQPFDVRLLALTTGGDAWQPGPMDVTVAKAADEAARKLEIFVRSIEQGMGLAVGLEKAQSERQIILLVVDANLQPLPAALATVNGLTLPNLAVLLVDAAASALDVEVWLAGSGLQSGAVASAKAKGLLRVAGPGALAAEMQLLLDEAGRRLSAVSEPAKAVDLNLAERARTVDGINLDVQPQLVGPGDSPPG
jgi:hypothetical protein